jgi:hypothetical protein
MDVIVVFTDFVFSAVLTAVLAMTFHKSGHNWGFLYLRPLDQDFQHPFSRGFGSSFPPSSLNGSVMDLEAFLIIRLNVRCDARSYRFRHSFS